MTPVLIHLTKEMVLAMHKESLAKFGGSDGIRDMGLLESALARPQQHQSYRPEVNIFELAGIYGEAIIKNHPFVDGNKRTGFLSIFTFLNLNGYDFNPPETSIISMIEGLAASQVNLSNLVRWISDYSVRT